MALQTPPITVGSGIGVDLGTNDSAFVSGTTTVASSNASAIYGTGNFQYVTVAGYVSGAYGISLGTSETVGDIVKVVPGGVVSGTFGGIQMEGAANVLINAGYIDSAATAVSMKINESYSARVQNTGEIWGKTAIRFTGGGAFLDNHGTIGSWDDEAVVGSATFDEIVNDGQIYGSIFMQAGADELTNSGLIRVSVDLGYDGDKLVNRGTIGGVVELDNGDDVAINRGTITGGLAGGSGDDVVTNRGTIEGLITLDDGFDTFRPGASIEVADGGTAGDGNSGFDTLDFSASSGVAVALDDSFDGTGWAAGDTFSGFEAVTGSLRKADIIAGTDGANYLDGQGGADKLYGRGGADTLIGGAGKDLLNGGAGTDFLSGGGGQDTFVFNPGDAGGANLTLADTIADFSLSDRDKIDLSAIDASSKAKGNQAFVFIGQQAFHNTAGELRIDQSDGVHTVLQADLDGNGLADFWIVLNGKPTIGLESLVL